MQTTALCLHECVDGGKITQNGRQCPLTIIRIIAAAARASQLLVQGFQPVGAGKSFLLNTRTPLPCGSVQTSDQRAPYSLKYGPRYFSLFDQDHRSNSMY